MRLSSGDKFIMSLFKKNIWLLFSLLLFIGTILLVAAFYHEYNNILNDTKNDQLYLTKLHQDRLNSLFHEHEILHNLIAHEYLDNQNFTYKKFDTVLSLNPLLVDIWIFSADGELLLSTLPDVAFPNLTQNKNTQQWFQETLNSDSMVIGRAYLLESINKWILPVRKKIIDKNGNIVAVSSTGIDLTMLHRQWSKEYNDQNTIQATLDNSAFRILRSDLTTEQYPDYYGNSLPSNILFSQNIAQLKAQLNAKSTANSEPFIQGIAPAKTGKVLYTLNYNEHYRFWMSTELPYQLVLQKIYKHYIFYFAFYLLLITLIFTLCYHINKIEKLKIDEITYKAEHDTLTKLPNLSLLNKHFYKLQKQAETPFALLYIDLDNFKNINDMFGHSYGDKVLIEVAKRISKSLAMYKGVAARFSGDDFVVFLESENKEEIAEYATLLLKNIAFPYLIDNNTFKISSSIGIACFPDDASNIEPLLSYTDNSMFMAKKRKNNYLFFSKEIHHQLIRNTEIEQALRNAIENQEISLVYQPQLDRENKLFGVEALVRWNSKKLGFVAPDIFIPIAEKTGLMPQLGLYIMHKAMQEITALKKREGLTFKLSINVSVKQFMQIDFIEKLMRACTYHTTDQAAITIEITESLFIENLDTLLPIFNEIKEHGISLSLDDFGTGYSSLSMLKKVPIDELKIDKSFVDHITEKQTDKEMLKSIIAMGKNLGISVLAEGVETQEQVEILQQANCDLFQGYYFSKPLSLNDLATFAKDHTPNLLQNATSAGQEAA